MIVSFSSYQSEDNPEQQEDVTSGKKKRRKKKKKTKSEDVEAESEGPANYQEPPKIEVTLISAFIYHSVTLKSFCSCEENKALIWLPVYSEMKVLFIFARMKKSFQTYFCLWLWMTGWCQAAMQQNYSMRYLSVACPHMCAQLIIWILFPVFNKLFFFFLKTTFYAFFLRKFKKKGFIIWMIHPRKI